MPPVSEKQRALMEAAAHGAKWATKKVSPTVAKEFTQADPGGKLPERKDRATRRYGGS